MVFIAIVPQRNQGVYETTEGIREFEILFLSSLRCCHIDDAKLIFYLDKPHQDFYDEVHALEWVTQADGVLITPSPVSDPCWECVVKDHHWQAVIPRKVRPLEQAPAIPDNGEIAHIEDATLQFMVRITEKYDWSNFSDQTFYCQD